MGTREERLEARCKTKLVEVPQWGQTRVRELTARGRHAVERALSAKEETWRAVALLHGIVNDDGTPMFRASDLAALNDLPASIVTPLFEALWDLSGFSEHAQEELRGNS